MNENGVNENCSDTEESTVFPDNNANNGNSNRKNIKNESTLSIKSNYIKINNNTDVMRNCCTMGLGNGNDTNLDIITKVSKVESQFNLKELPTNSDIERNYIKKYVERCSSVNDSNSEFQNIDEKNYDNNILDSHEINNTDIAKNKDLFLTQNECSNDRRLIEDAAGPSNGITVTDNLVKINPINSIQLNNDSNSTSSTSNISDAVDSENDDTSLSLSDDGCVYTYKGGGQVDLPQNFYLDNRVHQHSRSNEIPTISNHRPRSRDSSPEMDYLEMDFDPGPSCEADSESSIDIDLNEQCLNSKIESESTQLDSDLNLPSTSTGIRHVNSLSLNHYSLANISKQIDEQTPEDDSECSFVAESTSTPCLNENLEQNLAHSLFCYNENKSLTTLMFWNEQDAQQKQFTLLHAGCITNAVLNALLALNKIPPKIIPEWANQYLQANPRDIGTDDTDLVEYLLLKSKALPSHEDLISGLKIVSDGNVFMRFFSTWPERDFSISHWLQFWLEHKIIPILTINQQICAKDCTVVPEWEHHMVFGVSEAGIYLSDPINCVSEEIIKKKLTSDSIVFIKRSDILSRWKKETCTCVDLGPLYSIDDYRWHKVNTLGKLVHLLRDVKNDVNEKSGFNTSSFVPIPASVQAGITLVSSVDNPACDMLEYCPELPLKQFT